MKLQNHTKIAIFEMPVGLILALILLAIAFIYAYFILFPYTQQIFDNLSQNIAMINSKLMYRY